uniref:Ge1_WD40 domain-containing protein n=1 Tax=Trichuris muris TaxID=70415 RepID=A0A5S6QFV0_TRIMR
MPSEFQDMELKYNPDGESTVIDGSCTRIVLKDVNVPLKDCSKVVSELLNNYAWERKYQLGQLLSIHRSGALCAYAFRTRVSSFLRVIDLREKTRSSPVPIKKQVAHIAWAFSLLPPTVGIVDMYADMFFFQVCCNEELALVITPWLTISRELSAICSYPLFFWCPYAKREQYGTDFPQVILNTAQSPNTTTDSYASMIVATVGQQAQVMILSEIVKTKGAAIAYSKERCACVVTEESVVTYACLSPDGTALSVATEAGLVKLYILESFADVHRAHRWYPHGQKPVTTIVFLDSLCSVIPSYTSDVQFWKTAITSAEGNRELYLWECDSWQRTSAVEIPAASEASDKLGLFVSRDARFAIVSDVERQLLYIFEILIKAGKPRFCHFAYVCLFQPIISLDVKELRSTEINNAELLDEPNKEAITGLLICINPKSLLSLKLNIEKALPEDDCITNGSEQTPSSKSAIGNNEEKENRSAAKVSLFLKDKELEVALHEMTIAENYDGVHSVDSASTELTFPDSSADRASAIINEKPIDVDNMLIAPVNVDQPKGIIEESRLDAVSIEPLICDVAKSFTPFCDIDLLSGTSAEHDLPEALITETCYTTGDEGEKEIASLKALVIEQGNVLSDVVAQLQRIEESEMKVTKCLNELKEAVKLANASSSVMRKEPSEQHNAKAIAAALMGEISTPDNALIRNVRKEVQASLINGMPKMLMSNRQHVDRNLQRTFQCLKGQILQSLNVFHGKQFLDSISSKVSATVVNEMSTCFHNTVTAVLVPAFNDSIQKLFDNLNTVFQQGTQEYFEQLMAVQDNFSEEGGRQMLEVFTERIGGIGQELKTLLQKQLLSLIGVLKDSLVAKDIKELEAMKTSVCSALAAVVKEQISICMEENKNTLMETIQLISLSNATSEAPCRDPRLLREMLSQMVEKENYEQAFAEAISAGDPVLVTYVCSLVDVGKVFDSSYTLLSVSQSLELVHLIASSLTEEEIELKLQYLLAALATLDESATDVKVDAAIHEANYVMDMLAQYSEQNPNSPVASQIRVINLVAKAIARKKSS